MGNITVMSNEKSAIEMLDYFAAQALSGYARGGLSHMQREDECHEVATACYDLAMSMLKVRQVVADAIEDKTMRQE